MSCSQEQSMKYKLVIFDFDGTIADTSSGIVDSHKFALKAMHREIPDDNSLRSIIGGALLDTYMTVFGFNENDAREAVGIYRKYYAENGIHKARLYLGFMKMIKELRGGGCKMGVATLKAEKFANIMLDEFGIKDLFDTVHGIDDNDTLSKADLIKFCISECSVKQDETILIGDSLNDYKGAQQAGIDFLGVTYGFGFKPDEKYTFNTVGSVKDIAGVIKKEVMCGA